MEEKFKFILGDKLPTYHVALSIFSECQKTNSSKMTSTIFAYVKALIDGWIKSVGEEHVLGRKAVGVKVERVVEHYYNHVYVEAHRTKPKKKGMVFEKKSIRTLNKCWRHMTFAKTRIKVDSLFDICKDTHLLAETGKVLYEDQKRIHTRVTRVGEEIDLEYVLEKQRELEEEQSRLAREAEERYMKVSDNEDSSTTSHDDPRQLNTSVNRSGLSRSTVCTVDAAVQFEGEDAVVQPKIRSGARNCTNSIKPTCAEVSVKCNISTECSRIAVQMVCKGMYKHEYYLDRDEAIEKDPSLAEFRDVIPKIKKVKTDDKWKTPVTMQEYKVYENMLPTAKTINEHKQILALQHEKDTATALRDIAPGVKVTLHYDTTTRSKIDGDWPSLILIFSDNRRFSLRPIYFAYEDRDQIVRLILETYHQLSSTLIMDERPVTAKELWENTTAFMTDSVSKNLKVEDGVAEALQSNHKPYHLYKSHAVEAMDRSNLDVLASVEKQLLFRDKLVAINPAVHPFLRGVQTVVQTGMRSILNLISHDKSA